MDMDTDTNGMTTGQVSDALGCSRRAAQRWIADGILPAQNLASGQRPRYRIAEADFERLRASRRRPPRKRRSLEIASAMRAALKLGYIEPSVSVVIPANVKPGDILEYLHTRKQAAA